MTPPKFYIASTGMVNPVGANTAMTATSVKASISAYGESEYYDLESDPITMATVPDSLLEDLEADIDEGDRFNRRHDRIIRMAIIALRQACAQLELKQAMPLIMALTPSEDDGEGLCPLIPAVVGNTANAIDPALSRCLYGGRAAGIEAIDFVFQYLYDSGHKYIAIGSSDSYQDDNLLQPLLTANRLLSPNNSNSFAPGEAAACLILTPHPSLAQVRNGKIIALHPPGIGEETGHLTSEEPYRGDGLDQAFKKALSNHQNRDLSAIYSSMNGEQFWAKEFGVAQMRNREAFRDEALIHHPADCYGDLGTATAPTLIALAAEDLFNNPMANAHLVYSSADGATRGAVVVEKLPAAPGFEGDLDD